jgi:hypothetical protein
LRIYRMAPINIRKPEIDTCPVEDVVHDQKLFFFFVYI